MLCIYIVVGKWSHSKHYINLTNCFYENIYEIIDIKITPSTSVVIVSGTTFFSGWMNSGLVINTTKTSCGWPSVTKYNDDELLMWMSRQSATTKIERNASSMIARWFTVVNVVDCNQLIWSKLESTSSTKQVWSATGPLLWFSRAVTKWWEAKRKSSCSLLFNLTDDQIFNI